MRVSQAILVASVNSVGPMPTAFRLEQFKSTFSIGHSHPSSLQRDQCGGDGTARLIHYGTLDLPTGRLAEDCQEQTAEQRRTMNHCNNSNFRVISCCPVRSR